MSTTPRFLGLGVVLGLAAGLLGGVAFAASGRAADPTPSATPSVPSGAAPGSAPDALPSGTIGSLPAAGSSTAIAYPYFGGTPGIAPDHTIVVTGAGQSDLKVDGSDRATAQQRALQAALADAKAQADVIAAATGLTISGVLSVSASVWPDYGVMPMAGSPGGSTTGGATPPQIVSEPPLAQTLGVSVTVAYSVG